MEKLFTLCLVRDSERVLLGLKKIGFGSGRWNGFGGKVKEDESIEAAMARELEEEAGLQVQQAEPRGTVIFTFESGEPTVTVHLFEVSKFQGEPRETDEMRPQWFALDQIPYDSMWPADRHWLPIVLAGKKICGNFHYQEVANSTLLHHTIDLVEER